MRVLSLGSAGRKDLSLKEERIAGTTHTISGCPNDTIPVGYLMMRIAQKLSMRIIDIRLIHKGKQCHATDSLTTKDIDENKKLWLVKRRFCVEVNDCLPRVDDRLTVLYRATFTDEQVEGNVEQLIKDLAADTYEQTDFDKSLGDLIKEHLDGIKAQLSLSSQPL